MSFGDLTTRNEVARQRAKRPHREHATIAARETTLRESLAHEGGIGIGILVPSQVSVYPFDSQEEYDRYAATYDPIAMSRIARALRDPAVRARITHNTGTAPELHFVGKFLQLGWKIGQGIIFQDRTVAAINGIRRMHRVFVSDCALRFNGRFILCLINGAYFHERLQIERERDIQTGESLRRLGQVLMVPSEVCFEGRTLDAFLAQKLGTAV
jgi:hypothetical protein